MKKPTTILGISAFYHDSAAALVSDGDIIAAAQEERFTRIKGDSTLPINAIGFCLEQARLHERDLDYVVFYENTYAKFERLLTTYHQSAPHSLRSFLRSMPSWLTKKLWVQNQVADELGITCDVISCDHHLSHAASAFFPSPFEESAILTIDGVGEWSTSTYGVGRKNKIELRRHLRFPNSLGLLYSAFTYYTGFKINSGEYKLMGLAPYGKPIHVDAIKSKLVKIMPDGAVALNQAYFDYVGGLTMTNERFHNLFGGPPRKPETFITQKEMDIAASIQMVLNEIVMKMANHVHAETGAKNLCLAGGVALNVVSMGLLSSQGPFERLWIQPASGDAGGALGAALWLWYQVLGNDRVPQSLDSMHGSFLGFGIDDSGQDDSAVLQKMGAVWDDVGDDEALANMIAERIARGEIVALARGRAEFGPRALGARSILADARNDDMQRHLNMKVKFREGFRPFAPIVLAEDASDYFAMRQESPYMLLVYPVVEGRRVAMEQNGLTGLELLNQKRSEIPCVTHIDYSARVQTVDKNRNPFLYLILKQFKSLTGCSVLVNTSFNVRGEPIVNTAEDAYRCFMATEIDNVVIGNRFLSRAKQNGKPMDDRERELWLQRFELD